MGNFSKGNNQEKEVIDPTNNIDYVTMLPTDERDVHHRKDIGSIQKLEISSSTPYAGHSLVVT